MTRRDTIIIAVILNVALLAVLFTLAVHQEEELTPSPIPTKVVELFEPPASSISHESHSIFVESPKDEVDIVLQDFVASVQTPASYAYAQPEEIAPPLPSAADDKTEVVVKRGDALEKIARAHGTTVDAIKKANQLTNDSLRVGQTLLIPSSPSSVTAAAPATRSVTTPTVSSPSVETKIHTIKSGDNPWKIAKQYNMSVDELLRLNSLDEEKARNLKIGEKLKVK